MKFVLLIGIIIFSASASFAACSHNLDGDFVPFNGKTITVGSKKISITKVNGEEVVTIKDKEGTIHIHGGNESRLIEVIDNDYNRAQVSCQ